MHMKCQSMPTDISIIKKVTSDDNFQPNESHYYLSKRCNKNVSQIVGY
jgi:hypothetical protein